MTSFSVAGDWTHLGNELKSTKYFLGHFLINVMSALGSSFHDLPFSLLEVGNPLIIRSSRRSEFYRRFAMFFVS